MKKEDYQILSVGEGCLFIKLGEEIDPEINKRARKIAEYIEKHHFAGFIEAVITYTGVAVQYDPILVHKILGKEDKKIFSAVMEILQEYIAVADREKESVSRVREIPVCYGGEYGPDLEFVAEFNGLTVEEVIKIHTSGEYLCYMLGFAPGFSYLGGMDDRIAAPRKETPRLAIPQRSVGIAGKQTGIYPLSTPGGWQIIGRSAIELYTPNEKNITFLEAGDIVRFKSITESEYLEMRNSV